MFSRIPSEESRVCNFFLSGQVRWPSIYNDKETFVVKFSGKYSLKSTTSCYSFIPLIFSGTASIISFSPINLYNNEIYLTVYSAI